MVYGVPFQRSLTLVCYAQFERKDVPHREVSFPTLLYDGIERSLEQLYSIKFCVRLAENTSETLKVLQKVFKDDCISKSQSGRSHRAFKEGRKEVADEPRYDNVNPVSKVLRPDRLLSNHQIADTLKACATIVPEVLTAEKRELRFSRCQELLDVIQNELDFLKSVVTEEES